jgi:hypothetical protein
MMSMSGRATLARLLFLVLATAVVWPTWATAAREGSTRFARSRVVYTEPEVLRAFSRVGDKLYDAGYGYPGFGSNVAVAVTTSPHQGWNVAVYIYPRVSLAAASFRNRASTWRASGMAAEQLQNLVVAVVPKGRVLSRKAPPWPMPQLVLKALAIVSSSAR